MAPVGEEAVEAPEVHSTTGDEVDSKPPKVEDDHSGNGKIESVNVKVEIEEEVEPPSDLEAAIIKQIEYYFSDLNLPRDNFLKEQLQLDDGWVQLTVLTTFNRLAKLSKDSNVIATALRKSDSGLLEVHESDSKIRRNPDRALKVINIKELNSRTLYIKGFPTEATCDDLLSFFDKLVGYEKMVYRRDRKSNNTNGNKLGGFKGSVFLIFKKDREAMDFLAQSKNGDKICYNDTELEISSKDEYIARKAAERNKGKQDKETKQQPAKKEEKEFDYSKCGVLKLTNIVAETSREDLKSVFQPITSELFISFEKGAEEAFMRFVDEETAQKCLDQLTEGDKKLTTSKGEFNAVLMTGEEKETAIVKLKEDEAALKAKKSSFHGSHRGRGGGRGGHRGGRGGGGNRNPFSKNKGDLKRNEAPAEGNEDEPKKKHTKFDSDNEGD